MAVNAPEAAFDQTEFTNAVLKNAFELWFDPEIGRRQAAGLLPTPFAVWAAQVLLEVGEPAEIFFNDQIRGIFKAQIPPDFQAPIERGAQISLADMGEIVGMELTIEQPNASHLTAVLHKQTWYLLFDFRYNATRVARHLSVAREFLSAAEAAYSAKHYNVAVDNLFAAVELAAKSHLLMLPDERFLTSTRHGFVATRFNLHGGKHGNVDPIFVSLFNELTNEWTAARYPDEPLRVGASKIGEWLKTARVMLDDLDQKRPRRRSEGAGSIVSANP
jgi:HEPN domain-containing protein